MNSRFPSPLVLAALTVVLFARCSREAPPEPPAPEPDLGIATAVPAPVEERPDPPSEDPDPAGAPWGRETLEGLSLRRKVGQMLMPWVLGDFAPEGSVGYKRAVGLIEEQ